MWNRKLLEEQVRHGCTCGGCGKERWTEKDCAGCGFHRIEERRRKRLPLVQLPSGLAGLYVGRTKKYPPADGWRR